MDLPFAASDTYSFFVLMITFVMLIIGFAIIIFLNILYIKNNKIKNEEFYSQINKSFSELKESVDALGLMFSKIKDSLEDFKSDKKYPLLDDVFSIHYNLNYKCIKQYSLTNSCRPGAKSSNNVKTKEQTYIFAK